VFVADHSTNRELTSNRSVASPKADYFYQIIRSNYSQFRRFFICQGGFLIWTSVSRQTVTAGERLRKSPMRLYLQRVQVGLSGWSATLY
jgi:hypothetical protein